MASKVTTKKRPLNATTTGPSPKRIKLRLESSIARPVVGAVAMCVPHEGRQIKLAFVTIYEDVIKDRLSEVLQITFYPVTIHSGKGKKSDSIKKLGNVLFKQGKSFTKFAQADLAVKIHTSSKVPLNDLMDVNEINPTAICHQLKGLAMVQFPLNLEAIEHKSASKNEPTDRERAAEAIMSLYRVGAEPIVITNEATVKARLRNAVHGDLDLFFGLGFLNGGVVCMSEADLAETKKDATPLASRRMRKSVVCDKWDLAYVSQPVLQAILVGQIQQLPTACFFMTRNRFRPFLYYPKEDVMLTTARSFAWKYNARIGLRGCILLELLLGGAWKSRIVSAAPTNFVKVLRLKNIDIQRTYTIAATRKKTEEESDDSDDEEYFSKNEETVEEEDIEVEGEESMEEEEDEDEEDTEEEEDED